MKNARSADGTTIAYETIGTGPALLLIGGAFNDHRSRAAGTPLAKGLAERFTVTTFDRRGRGESADTLPWSIAREAEDVAAVVLAIGGHATLYGHSSGAILAVEAALAGARADALVLYEPPIALDPARRATEAMAQEIDALCAAGRRGDAAEIFLGRGVGMPAPVIANMRQAPMWPGLQALAHTLSRDVRLSASAMSTLERARSLEVPATVFVGAASPPWMQDATRAIAEALRTLVRVLGGQTHDVDPAVLAEAMLG